MTATTFGITKLAPVVPKLDSVIHWVNHYPVEKYYRETNCALYWIDIYPMDSVIPLLNNWDLDFWVPWTLLLKPELYYINQNFDEISVFDSGKNWT